MIRKRNVSYLNERYCKGCKAIKHCAGGCMGKMIVETHSLYKATSDWCEAVKYLFDRIQVGKAPFPCLHS